VSVNSSRQKVASRRDGSLAVSLTDPNTNTHYRLTVNGFTLRLAGDVLILPGVREIDAVDHFLLLPGAGQACPPLGNLLIVGTGDDTIEISDQDGSLRILPYP
jgi:hypothetical protein